MFSYRCLHERHWQFHCTQTCRHEAIDWWVEKPAVVSSWLVLALQRDYAQALNITRYAIHRPGGGVRRAANRTRAAGTRAAAEWSKDKSRTGATQGHSTSGGIPVNIREALAGGRSPLGEPGNSCTCSGEATWPWLRVFVCLSIRCCTSTTPDLIRIWKQACYKIRSLSIASTRLILRDQDLLIFCANFFAHVLSTWRLPINTKMGAQSYGIGCQISNPVFLVFYNNFQDSLKYILLLLQFEIFSAFALLLQVSHQADYFLTCSNHMRYARQQLEQHLLNHLCAIAMFAFTQLHSISAAFTLPLSSTCAFSYPRCGTRATSPWRHDVNEAEGSALWNHQIKSLWGSALRFEAVAVTYITMCTRRKLQLNKMPGHNVLCCAARRAKSLQRSKQSWLILYFFPCCWIFPSREEKNSMSREKIGTEGKIRSQLQDRTLLERARRALPGSGAEQGSWPWQGWGPGPCRARGRAGDVHVPA